MNHLGIHPRRLLDDVVHPALREAFPWECRPGHTGCFPLYNPNQNPE